VPYDSLDNPEKDKDYNAFLWALDISDDDLKLLDLAEESKRMVQLAKTINLGA
jgi:aminopeptidase-like protein